MAHASARPDLDRDGWLRRLAGYCWRYPRHVLLALGGTLVVTVVAAIIPLIQRQIVDDLVGPGHPAVWPLAVLLMAAALASEDARCRHGAPPPDELAGRIGMQLRYDIVETDSNLDKDECVEKEDDRHPKAGQRLASHGKQNVGREAADEKSRDYRR